MKIDFSIIESSKNAVIAVLGVALVFSLFFNFIDNSQPSPRSFSINDGIKQAMNYNNQKTDKEKLAYIVNLVGPMKSKVSLNSASASDCQNWFSYAQTYMGRAAGVLGGMGILGTSPTEAESDAIMASSDFGLFRAYMSAAEEMIDNLSNSSECDSFLLGLMEQNGLNFQ